MNIERKEIKEIKNTLKSIQEDLMKTSEGITKNKFLILQQNKQNENLKELIIKQVLEKLKF